MRKPKIGREAMAPMLGALLLVAITVSIGVIVLQWSQVFFVDTSKDLSNIHEAQIEAAKTSIAIEAVNFPSSNQVQIVVRNVGQVAVNLGGLNIDSKFIRLTYDATPEYGDPAEWVAYDSQGNAISSFDPDGTVPVAGYAIICASYSWSSNTTYEIQVSTTTGAVASCYATAP